MIFGFGDEKVHFFSRLVARAILFGDMRQNTQLRFCHVLVNGFSYHFKSFRIS